MNFGKKNKTEQTAEEKKAAGGKLKKLPKLSRKTLLIALGAIVAVVVIGIVVWGGPLEVSVEVAAAAPFADTFTETGNVKAGPAREYLSPAAGRIAEVKVHKNSAVKAGDVLLRIDSTELEYALQSHRNALDGYRAQVNESIRSLRGELSNLQAERSSSGYDKARDLPPEAYLENLRTQAEVARSEAEIAETEFNCAKALYEIGAESKVAMEEAENAYRTKLSESEGLERQYQEASKRLAGDSSYYSTQDQSYAVRIQTTQESLNDYVALAAAEDTDAEVFSRLTIGKQMAEEMSQIAQLEDKLERCTVRATADGFVSDLPAETLTTVSENDRVATVRERSGLTLEVNVLTSEEPFLRVGDSVALTQKLKGQQTVYEGKISEIGNYAEKGLSATGAEEYRVRVVVSVPEDAGLKDGYELEAKFTTYRSDAAITVPNSALFKMDGQDYVFVVNGVLAQARSVEIAHKGVSRTEIASGVRDGEQVIIDANTEDLADGTAVMPSAD